MHLNQPPFWSASDIINGTDENMFATHAVNWSPKTQRPVTGLENERRAQVLSTLLYSHCLGHVEQIVRHGAATTVANVPTAPSKNLEYSLKVLTCVSIHSIGIESGGVKNPEWFVIFLFNALRATDARCLSPSARAILQWVGSMRYEFMMSTAMKIVFDNLGVDDSSILVRMVEAFLSDNEIRSQLLYQSLTCSEPKLTTVCVSNLINRLSRF